MAWLPSSCHPVYRCLWIPDLREGDDSPLRTSFRRSAPATYPTPQLPTPRILPCGLNGTSQTRSPPCAEGSSLLSLVAYHAARAVAELQSGNARAEICNAVVVERIPRIAAGDLAHPCFPSKRPAGRSNEPFIAHRPSSPSAQGWCRARRVSARLPPATGP